MPLERYNGMVARQPHAKSRLLRFAALAPEPDDVSPLRQQHWMIRKPLLRVQKVYCPHSILISVDILGLAPLNSASTERLK